MLLDLVKALLKRATEMPRRRRRVVVALTDFALLTGVVWLLLSLRYQDFYVPTTATATLAVLAGPVITVALFLMLRVYHLVARYLGARGSLRLAGCVALATVVWSALLLFLGQSGVPRSVLVGYAILGSVAAIGLRVTSAMLLRLLGIQLHRRIRLAEKIPVLIYGSGDLAVQLGRAMANSRTRKLIGFVDSSEAMIGRTIDGYRIHKIQKIPKLMIEPGVEEIIIAVEHQKASDRRMLLQQLAEVGIRVRFVPNLEHIAMGRIQSRDLRGIEGSDLLGREQVPPDPRLLQTATAGKSIMITGAGGSIGSQLSRHLLDLSPSRLILIDHSEAALHEIEKELTGTLERWPAERERPQIVTVLGSIQNAQLMDEVTLDNGVQTIFHAAAFKHVPIVEKHPIVGVTNNTLGTELLARVAMKHGVERFVLISTDKAVRPKSVLGASKRFAELILQALARQSTGTIFTSVRFGNVLDSSGSVIQRFREQILAGGPVTVTDPNVVRYFMSLEEAANLVIQAAGLAKGGEVFLLDMGQPVKIDNLARSMIRLYGLEVRSEDNPEGDIEIQYVGLRPGEKLVEELLTSDDNASGTEHPRIMRSLEPSPSAGAILQELETLRRAIAQRDADLVVASLVRAIEGYSPDPHVIFLAQSRGRRVVH